MSDKPDKKSLLDNLQKILGTKAEPPTDYEKMIAEARAIQAMHLDEMDKRNNLMEFRDCVIETPEFIQKQFVPRQSVRMVAVTTVRDHMAEMLRSQLLVAKDNPAQAQFVRMFAAEVAFALSKLRDPGDLDDTEQFLKDCGAVGG